jgi:hypothetical protein
VRSEWLENIIISSNDNASGAKTTTRTLKEREKERGIFLSFFFSSSSSPQPTIERSYFLLTNHCKVPAIIASIFISIVV